MMVLTVPTSALVMVHAPRMSSVPIIVYKNMSFAVVTFVGLPRAKTNIKPDQMKKTMMIGSAMRMTTLRILLMASGMVLTPLSGFCK